MLETRQKLVKTEEGFSRDNWSSFAELGWLALPFAEESGGFGGTAVETMIMMEEFGKGLVIEPFLQTAVIAGGFLKHAGSDAQKEEHLQGIIGGEKITNINIRPPHFNIGIN